ncbi:uncharacterized protein LOC115886648 [Sitophilus oryzae]|uniref:Uncharacterized protein LOC115886648 n=1 Tax=Sitophilus oryzae TaxID=7048 RepID=A0A6J2YF44_SITOR|nr:uncharacterized protein LOC115886648 [Sitophilus oryzae]
MDHNITTHHHDMTRVPDFDTTDFGLENSTPYPLYADEYATIFNPLYIIHIMWLLVSIIVISLDIYLIVVIKKFKTLENARSYKYLLVYAISHLCYMLLSDCISMFLRMISQGLSTTGTCLVSSIDYACIEMVSYSLTFMAIDWYAFHYYKWFHDKYLKVFNHGILIAFLILLLKTFVVFITCFVNESHIEEMEEGFYFLDYFRLISFFVCFITIMAIFLIWKRKNTSNIAKKYDYSIVVPWTYFLMSLPLNLYEVVHLFVEYEHYNGHYITFLMSLAILSYFGVIVVVFLLGKHDKHFKMAYLKCCKRRYKNNNFQDEVSDDGSEENGVTYNGHIVSL